MSYMYKEQFADIGEAKELKVGKDSKLVFQWRTNTTKGHVYLSIGKKHKYPVLVSDGNGGEKAEIRERFKSGIVVGADDVPRLLHALQELGKAIPEGQNLNNTSA